ncbi:hypothetical protein HDU81_006404 [Chytriomyces hyalinus]|nr:hypothetical protein HDU81_006404 [Chytriomyces hyalinus]
MTTEPATLKHRVRNHCCLRGPRLFIWAAFILALVLALAFLVPRKPVFTVAAVDLNTENIAALFPLRITSTTSASVFLILQLAVDNTNFYSVTVEQMNFRATHPLYDNGNSAFATASNVSTFTLPMRAPTTLSIPFTIQYDVTKDPSFKFARIASSACVKGTLAGEGDGFPAKIDVTMSVTALGIKGLWIHYFEEQVIKCPKV